MFVCVVNVHVCVLVLLCVRLRVCARCVCRVPVGVCVNACVLCVAMHCGVVFVVALGRVRAFAGVAGCPMPAPCVCVLCWSDCGRSLVCGWLCTSGRGRV